MKNFFVFVSFYYFKVSKYRDIDSTIVSSFRTCFISLFCLKIGSGRSDVHYSDSPIVYHYDLLSKTLDIYHFLLSQLVVSLTSSLSW